MLSLTTTLTKATTAAGAKPVRRVQVDFGRDGTYSGTDDISKYVTGISLQRSLTTDMPDGTRLVAGYSASSATIDLGGDPLDNAKTATWVWSPRNPDAPYYGKKRLSAPIKVELGFDTGTLAAPNPEYAVRFEGYVTDLNALELTGGDMAASRLRNQVLLPMATNLGHPSLDGRYFVDFILTANGINLADCDLEDSLNPLTATPYSTDKQDSWTLIQQIAAAENATAFFDAAGKFHFWNRYHFLKQSVDYTAMTVTVNGHTSPIPTITSLRDLKTLNTIESLSSIRNHIQVNYTSYLITLADWIWQSTFPHGVHSKGSETIWATLDNPAQSISTDFVNIPIGGDTGGKSGYRANTKPDGTGDPIENLTATITPISATSVKIVVHNPNSYPVYLVMPRADSVGHLYPGWDASSPTPMLMLYGRQVTAAPVATSTTNGATTAYSEFLETASMDPDTGYGEQLLTIDGNGWIQDPDTAYTLAVDMGSILAYPIFYLADVDVVGDLRYELGDRAVLEDTTGTALDDHVWIVGITESPSIDGGYSQTLTLRMCAAVGSMIWGDPVRGKWGAGFKWGGVY